MLAMITPSCTANPAGFLDGVTIGVVGCVLVTFAMIRRYYK
jgi:hypothetical protein